MSLAIASPAPSVYSETFIKSQFDKLKWRLRLHGEPIGSFTEPGGDLLPNEGPLARRVSTIAMRCLQKCGVLDPHIFTLRSRLRKATIKCVLANYGPTAVQLVPICESLRIKLCVHFHGFDTSKRVTLETYGSHYRKVLPRMHSILAVSRDMKRRLLELGAPAEKIQLVRYGVDTSFFKPPDHREQRKTFLSVGRFVDKKAPHLTLLAFKNVCASHPEARLVMGGEGELLEATRNMASALGIRSNVEFPGVLSRSEVVRHMQQADIFVQHSLVPRCGPYAGDSEGTPVAILEAMACGMPVVSTKHGGIPDAVEHEDQGLLIEERDVAGMANAMCRLLDNPLESDRMGRSGRVKVERSYTLKQYIDSLEAVLVGT
jgi:colanic acid/amylovoran biosynthesis glycosyltransferase